jgi:hypothetical protein
MPTLRTNKQNICISEKKEEPIAHAVPDISSLFSHDPLYAIFSRIEQLNKTGSCETSAMQPLRQQ